MFVNTEGLVLREVRYKEADRILTLLTPAYGKITVKARGALRRSSRIAAATQQLTWSDFVLFRNKERWSVNEASVKEDFAGLRGDLTALSLGCYAAECIDTVSVEDQPEPELLQLALNMLYAVSQNTRPQAQLKAAFELRLASLTGYMPDLRSCCVCGSEQPEEPSFGSETGRICCRHCRPEAPGTQFYLGDEGLAAARYIVSAPAKRLFSFHVGEESLGRLSEAAEAYFIYSAGRRFGTLDYYRSLLALSGGKP